MVRNKNKEVRPMLRAPYSFEYVILFYLDLVMDSLGLIFQDAVQE